MKSYTLFTGVTFVVASALISALVQMRVYTDAFYHFPEFKQVAADG